MMTAPFFNDLDDAFRLARLALNDEHDFSQRAHPDDDLRRSTAHSLSQAC
jgi:hypothetical protein